MVLYIIKAFCFFRRRDSLSQLRVERRWFELALKGDLVIGNLRTTTTTGSEIQCTAQARLANFVVVVSSTTPNTVQSRRPASQASAGMNPLFLGDFLSVLCIFFVFVNPGILSFFS